MTNTTKDQATPHRNQYSKYFISDKGHLCIDGDSPKIIKTKTMFENMINSYDDLVEALNKINMEYLCLKRPEIQKIAKQALQKAEEV